MSKMNLHDTTTPEIVKVRLKLVSVS
jgi:hypothetical protein